MSKIHERLIEARKHFKMSQSDVANATGLSQNGISLIEKGERQKPNLDYIDFWVKQKEVSYDWLIHNEGDMFISKEINYNPLEFEKIQRENKYLKKEIEELKQQMKQLVGTINLLSGKPSEHKKAANPNVKNNSLSGWSYVPAP